MPPEEATAQKEVVASFGRLFNWLKMKSNEHLGTRFHEIIPPRQQATILQTYNELQKLLNFQDIGDLNAKVIRAERFWDGGPEAWKASAAGTIRKEVFQLYKDLGHFCDQDALKREEKLVVGGTKLDKESVEINVPGLEGGRLLEFTIPQQEKIVFSHGLGYDVAFVGAENLPYYKTLESEIKGFIERIKNELLEKPDYDQRTKDYIENNCKKLHHAITIAINEGLTKHMIEFENKHRAFLSSLLERARGGFEKLPSLVLARRLEEDMVRYRHTYRIIKPNKLPINLDTFWQESNEVDYGLDEHGWPLEVAEENYNFLKDDGTWKRITKGTVLLDVFNRKQDVLGNPKYRLIPPEHYQECTDYCDLLDMSAWVYVNWDAYRDDLRDGRYHPESLSIMEYILQMPNLKTEYLEFNHANLDQDIVTQLDDNEDGTLHTSAVMRLNAPYQGVNEVTVEMESSQLNPAFDLRRPYEVRSQKDIHLGRKLYYDVQDNSALSVKPTMTSRGAALFILAHVIENVKTFEDQIKLLDIIGNDTLGYDIGPNIQGHIGIDKKTGKSSVELRRWGEVFTKNPFKPISGIGWRELD